MMNWINVKDEFPEFCKTVLVYYSDEDGSNEGIMIASLQINWYSISDYNYWWSEEYCLKGECYMPDYSIVRCWFDYQEYLNYPNVSKSN